MQPAALWSQFGWRGDVSLPGCQALPSIGAASEWQQAAFVHVLQPGTASAGHQQAAFVLLSRTFGVSSS